MGMFLLKSFFRGGKWIVSYLEDEAVDLLIVCEEGVGEGVEIRDEEAELYCDIVREVFEWWAWLVCGIGVLGGFLFILGRFEDVD